MRQDLDKEITKKAVEKGWTIVEGKYVGDPRSFTKDNFTVWRCIHSGEVSWAKAILIDGRYREHTYNSELSFQLEV